MVSLPQTPSTGLFSVSALEQPRNSLRSDVAASLKRQTQSAHHAVEIRLNLLDPDLDLPRLTQALSCLRAFWAGAEPAVERWSVRHPDLARRLSWPRRRRAALLTADLAALGGQMVAPVSLWAGEPSTAEVFGWLYVSEGSTLGGAVIARHLRALDLCSPPVLSFQPYPEGPGPMWLAYQSALADWTFARSDLASQVVTAATHVFDRLRDWCDDLAGVPPHER